MDSHIQNHDMPTTDVEHDDSLLHADIPEKFKNPETGDVNVAAMAKSYKELERQFSQTPRPPKTPQEYCIDCAHGLFEADEEVNQRLHAKGFTQEQAQEVYNLAADKMVPMVKSLHADMQADREVEKLIGHFGGVEKWKDVSRQLLAFGRQNMPADVLDNLSSSYEGVLALYRMMKGGEPSLSRAAPKAMGGMDEMELKSLMRDPKYWREKDPATVAKVTQGFESLYGQ